MSSWADDKILGLDTETVGLEPDSPLVSFALASFDLRAVTKVRYGLVNPEVPIPEEATKIHSITDEMVKARGGNLKNTIDGIVDSLLLAEAEETPVVGANLRFDLTIIDSLFRKYHDGGGLRDVGWNGNVIDVQVIDRRLDKYRKGSRTLLALCAHYGVDPGNSHSAADDAVASVKVAIALADKYPEIQIEPYLLHAQQIQWRREWARDFSTFRVGKGESPLNESEGDWPLIGDA